MRSVALFALLVISPAWSVTPLPLSAQEPEPATLVVLDQVYEGVPALWTDPPWVAVGDWLKPLGLQWDSQRGLLVLSLPSGKSTDLPLPADSEKDKGKEGSSGPLVREVDGHPFVCLPRLCEVVSLRGVCSRNENLIRIGIPVLSAQVRSVTEGYLLEVQVRRPLNQSPKVRTLSDPNRAYIDLPGTLLTDDIALEETPAGPITRIRIGQFSQNPNIVRVVADCLTPVSSWLVGREREVGGTETWKMLIQEKERPSPWVGQVTLHASEPRRAWIVLPGAERFPPSIENRGKELIVALPATPLLPPVVAPLTDGPIASVHLTQRDEKPILIVSLRQPGWGVLQFDRERGFILIVEPLTGGRPGALLIVLDAGHGGKDPGATAHPKTVKNPLVEKVLTLDIALRLKSLLEKAGFQVVMTRSDDTYVPLADRVALANSLQADAFISIHINAHPRPGEKCGVEVYYWSPQSRVLAEALYSRLLTLGRGGNGVRVRQFYVVHHTTMPSALAENCYINHPEDAALLQQPSFRQKIARALFQGILDFFQIPETLERRRE